MRANETYTEYPRKEKINRLNTNTNHLTNTKLCSYSFGKLAANVIAKKNLAPF